MVERFTPLDPRASVFRLTRRAGGFLPEGSRLPKPEWLEPTDEDQGEADQRGRLAAGLSVWDRARTTVRWACVHRGVSVGGQLAFCIEVAAVRGAASRHARDADVVSDPETFREDNEHHRAVPEAERIELARALEGHSLIEGIRRPAGTAKKQHRAFLADLAECFEPFSFV